MQNRTSALSGSSVGSSTDAMARIPFIVPDANEGPMQSTSKQGSDLLTKHAGREGSMASFPAEVDGEHSSNGYGTPGTLGELEFPFRIFFFLVLTCKVAFRSKLFKRWQHSFRTQITCWSTCPRTTYPWAADSCSCYTTSYSLWLCLPGALRQRRRR
jgi:hypothetical protein